MQGAQICSLFTELRSHIPQGMGVGAAKKILQRSLSNGILTNWYDAVNDWMIKEKFKEKKRKVLDT